ncbi:MAG: 50S ribosomal protein L18 [Deltaproteobacteria bacterium]|nr:50S ribosomal protein L18 [Deltaproteobacteria bacterium]NIS77008.1 50S ribosomal protein L18 [Deltaproteobacteria bacterium]
MEVKQKSYLRARRKKRIRKKIFGVAERPRLSVFRSAKHIYAQIIDDSIGSTILTVSTLNRDVKEKVKGLKKTEAAKVVGQVVAEKAIEKGLKKIVFDRNGFIYHGRVKALAEGAREAGLEF